MEEKSRSISTRDEIVDVRNVKNQYNKQYHRKKALKNACLTTGCCCIPALLLGGFFSFPFVFFITGGDWFIFFVFLVALFFGLEYFIINDGT